jgi:hypothetical protein
VASIARFGGIIEERNEPVRELGMPRKSRYDIPKQTWTCPHGAFVHTAADLLRLDSDRFQCKSCGKPRNVPPSVTTNEPRRGQAVSKWPRAIGEILRHPEVRWAGSLRWSASDCGHNEGAGAAIKLAVKNGLSYPGMMYGCAASESLVPQIDEAIKNPAALDQYLGHGVTVPDRRCERYAETGQELYRDSCDRTG